MLRELLVALLLLPAFTPALPTAEAGTTCDFSSSQQFDTGGARVKRTSSRCHFTIGSDAYTQRLERLDVQRYDPTKPHDLGEIVSLALLSTSIQHADGRETVEHRIDIGTEPQDAGARYRDADGAGGLRTCTARTGIGPASATSPHLLVCAPRGVLLP